MTRNKDSVRPAPQCLNCGHAAPHDPPGCTECFDEPAAGGLCQTFVSEKK